MPARGDTTEFHDDSFEVAIDSLGSPARNPRYRSAKAQFSRSDRGIRAPAQRYTFRREIGLKYRPIPEMKRAQAGDFLEMAHIP
jgi:hypothetical protein